MNKEIMLKAFRKLDLRLTSSVRLIVGGGAALIVAHGILISTQDVDGVPDKFSIDIADFKKEVRAVGRELKIAPDWLNDYFSTFLFVLPSNYGSRLITLFQGKQLKVCALSCEDLILMKCFAGREKDIPHARALMKKKPNLKLVDDRLQELLEKKIPGASKAADFFDDLVDEMEVDL